MRLRSWSSFSDSAPNTTPVLRTRRVTDRSWRSSFSSRSRAVLGEARQVAERVVEVAAAAVDRLGDLALPVAERVAGLRVERGEDLVELDRALTRAFVEPSALGDLRAPSVPGVSST